MITKIQAAYLLPICLSSASILEKNKPTFPSFNTTLNKCCTLTPKALGWNKSFSLKQQFKYGSYT